MTSHPSGPSSADGTWTTEDRQWARARLEKKRGFLAALAAYVLINLGLVAVWAASGGGYFWPGWVLGAWGIGMLLAAWDIYWRPITEEDVDRELRSRR